MLLDQHCSESSYRLGQQKVAPIHDGTVGIVSCAHYNLYRKLDRCYIGLPS